MSGILSDYSMWRMMDGYNDPWSWFWMTLVMVLFWGGVIGLIVWAIRSTRGRTAPNTAASAVEVLQRRFAAGEITQDEYEKTGRALKG